jgi:diguanylate cyclase (GGDEF)-like protein
MLDFKLLPWPPPEPGKWPKSPSRLPADAYWSVMRQLIGVSGAISLIWALLFGWFNAPIMSAVSGVGVALYALAHLLLRHQHQVAAMALVWLEVLAHTAMASILLGWDSAFHLHLLICIPGAVVVSGRGRALTMVAALFAFYLALDAACTFMPPVNPLTVAQLQFVKWINFSLVFGVFFSMASLYRSTVVRSELGLMAQATTDSLTGLYNRSHFIKRAETELTRSHRTQEPLSLVMSDIDFFKQVNDEHGHHTGDRVLIQVAQILQGAMREVDVLARWGGEEFLLLLPNTDTTAAVAIAQRIRLALETTPTMNEGTPLTVTMSFGIAQVNPTENLSAAIVRADQALYRSKDAGRNQIHIG